MNKKLSNNTEKKDYEFISLKITDYNIRVSAGRNYHLLDLNHCDESENIFNFETHIECEAVCLEPEKLKGFTCNISLTGTDRKQHGYELTLADCQLTEGMWNSKVYKTVKGEEIPVYDFPETIGYIQKHRGEKHCSGAVWMLPRSITDMLAVLPHSDPLYLSIHAIKNKTSFAIVSLALQTNDPLAE